MDNATTQTITLALRGDGSALENVQRQSSFGLMAVDLDPPVVGAPAVMWVPDPDNDQNTIFWVRDAIPFSAAPASGVVTLKLTYSGE